jgi:hypothetical protein
MHSISQVLQDLKQAKTARLTEIKRIEDALAALGAVSKSRGHRAARRVASRRLSAAGRARIAAAQRLRWAKMRTNKKKS